MSFSTSSYRGPWGRGKVRNRYYLKISQLTVRGLHRRKLALRVFELFAHGGLRGLGSLGSRVLGGPGVAQVLLSGQRGIKEEPEALLGDHPAGM